MLDTGAAATVLDAGFARTARVRLGGGVELEGRGGDRDARRAATVALTIEGGPAAAIDPVVADISDASRAMQLPLAGILGEDVLKAYVLVLNYRDRTLALERAAEAPADAVAIRFGQTPYVSARAVYGDRAGEAEFQIDTGSNTAVEFWRPYSRTTFAARGTRDIGLGVAGASTIERGRIDSLEVAGRRIDEPDVNFADDVHPDDAGPAYGGVIGGPAWAGLVVTLDLPGRRMWIR